MRNTFVTRIKKHNSRKKRSYKKKSRSRKRRSFRKKRSYRKKPRSRKIRSYRKKQRLYGGSPSPSPGSPTSEWSGKASDLPLSIQMHEFALFVHYQLEERSDIIFYVQPRKYMGKQLDRVYGTELTKYVKYTPLDMEGLNYICDGKIPTWSTFGTKLNFDVILDRYNGSIPPEYILDTSLSIKDDKYVGPNGFLLLQKNKHEAAIKAFYTTVRSLFCGFSPFDKDDYIHSLKEEFPLPEGQSWGNFGSLAWGANFKVSDALDYIVYLINRTDIADRVLLRRLVEHFVNLFSDMIGDVRYCILPEMEGIEGIDRIELKAPYVIVKLKDPSQSFTYDNTEMVVNKCYFKLGHPAQYHYYIMRNPSDMIRDKLKKLCPDRYQAIEELNRPPGKRLF